MAGLVSIGIAILISQVKGPMGQISGSILGAVNAPMAVVFFLSIFVRCTTRRGLYSSVIVGACFAMWLSLGSNFSPGRLQPAILPLGHTDKCFSHHNTSLALANFTTTPYVSERLGHNSLYDTTVTLSKNTTPGIHETIHGLNWLYTISYLYISLLVSIVSICAGLIVSKLTDDRPVKVPDYLMLTLNARFFKCLPNDRQLVRTHEDVS
ncbi:hypothetical protein DPMN_016840 [Dreissena polymorpha]|uniref:Sodium-coupled monocarboxylate transporter 1 n=1 Tax=Dreissena polymorpha TaxID=45954 RepID=A0A9D4NFJ1_DREPO|nr:hypothetical protein DPMN_016840 [Dreissena polymorpha]